MKKTGKREKPIYSKNISSRRKRLGWNQEDLSHKVGVSLTSIKDIERGASEGHFDTRTAIAKVLGCSVADFYKEANWRDFPDFTSAVAFLSDFQNLSPGLQKIVLAIVHKDISYAADLPPEFEKIGKSLAPILKVPG